MKEHKISAILYLVNTILFAVIAVVNFIDNNNNTSGVVYAGLSVVWLGLFLNYLKKYKNFKKNK